MTPEDIKSLRQELACTAKELAAALGLEQETVLAWERGDEFPTKRFVTQMGQLRSKGKEAFPRAPRKGAAKASPMAALNDPELWRLMRKLLAHPALRQQAQKLAEAYADPLEEPSKD